VGRLFAFFCGVDSPWERLDLFCGTCAADVGWLVGWLGQISVLVYALCVV
jgi:hypothetical protein